MKYITQASNKRKTSLIRICQTTVPVDWEERTYGDVTKRRIRELWQGDGRLVEVGWLVGERNRVVRIGRVAGDVASN